MRHPQTLSSSMALEEQDREDLLGDGRAMPIRGETTIDTCVVIVGFRGNAQVSLYCGSDPVFQFNAGGQLRRVYWDGRRFAAADGRLVELTRKKRGGKVQFDSTAVDQPSDQRLLDSLAHWLERLRLAVADDQRVWRVVGERADEFRERVRGWIDARPTSPAIADSPNA